MAYTLILNSEIWNSNYLLAPLLSLFPFLKNKISFPEIHTCLRSMPCLVNLCRNKYTFSWLLPYFCPLYTLFQMPIVSHGYASSKVFVNDKPKLAEINKWAFISHLPRLLPIICWERAASDIIQTCKSYKVSKSRT